MGKFSYPPSSIHCDHSTNYSCDCGEQEFTDGYISLRKTIFGFIRNEINGENEPVSKFTWRNRNAMSVSVMTYGQSATHSKKKN